VDRPNSCALSSCTAPPIDPPPLYHHQPRHPQSTLFTGVAGAVVVAVAGFKTLAVDGRGEVGAVGGLAVVGVAVVGGGTALMGTSSSSRLKRAQGMVQQEQGVVDAAVVAGSAVEAGLTAQGEGGVGGMAAGLMGAVGSRTAAGAGSHPTLRLGTSSSSSSSSSSTSRGRVAPVCLRSCWPLRSARSTAGCCRRSASLWSTTFCRRVEVEVVMCSH